MARTSDAKVTRPVAQLAKLDLNLLWCEDDDDPAHRWLRQNLQMLAAEV